MKESTLHQKLENIVSAGKPKTIKINGKNIYISKKKIIECEKEGVYFTVDRIDRLTETH